MKITKTWLLRQGACADQVQRFAEVFPRGTRVTLESLAKAREAGLPVNWLRDRMPTEYQTELDALYTRYWDELDALNARYRIEQDALKVRYWVDRTGMDARYRAERDALYARYQPEWDALLVRAFEGDTKP